MEVDMKPIFLTNFIRQKKLRFVELRFLLISERELFYQPARRVSCWLHSEYNFIRHTRLQTEMKIDSRIIMVLFAYFSIFERKIFLETQKIQALTVSHESLTIFSKRFWRQISYWPPQRQTRWFSVKLRKVHSLLKSLKEPIEKSWRKSIFEKIILIG